MGWLLGFGIPIAWIVGWLWTGRVWSDYLYRIPHRVFDDDSDVFYPVLYSFFGWPIVLPVVLILKHTRVGGRDWSNWFVPTRAKELENKRRAREIEDQAAALERKIRDDFRGESEELLDGLNLAVKSMRDQAKELRKVS